MKRYYNHLLATSVDGSSSTINSPTARVEPEATPGEVNMEVALHLEPSSKVVDLLNLPSDPGLRPSIMSYPPNLIEQVRRAYLLKGPCQPRNHDFPQKIEANRKRKFVSAWFDEFKMWLEYSIAKDAAFCLYCYLFSSGSSEKGHDAFISGGFNTWRKKDRLRDHVGEVNSDHNKCRLACQDLMNQAQHIEVTLSRVSKQSQIDYRSRLDASIKCLRYLLMQGMAFRGHDESEESLNQGNFMELLKLLASCSKEISNVVLKNAPENLKLTSPDIQKDIINAIAVETTRAIIDDIGNDFFAILVDECRDVSVKEQMGIVLRYVNKKGCVIERFIGLVHVSDTIATSLEKGIDSLFSTYGLSISSLRGQGFDIEKLLRLAKFYPSEFSEVALYELESQLENFIVDVRMDEKFLGLSGIGDLAEKMVSTRKHDIFPLVYLLVKLSLTLPVATATVERAFSAMKIIKSVLRNRMGDNLLNDCLVPYIEKDVFVNVTNEAIMQRFQSMKNRREMLLVEK